MGLCVTPHSKSQLGLLAIVLLQAGNKCICCHGSFAWGENTWVIDEHISLLKGTFKKSINQLINIEEFVLAVELHHVHADTCSCSQAILSSPPHLITEVIEISLGSQFSEGCPTTKSGLLVTATGAYVSLGQIHHKYFWCNHGRAQSLFNGSLCHFVHWNSWLLLRGRTLINFLQVQAKGQSQSCRPNHTHDARDMSTLACKWSLFIRYQLHVRKPWIPQSYSM